MTSGSPWSFQPTTATDGLVGTGVAFIGVAA
jgi:hypothetical protein